MIEEYVISPKDLRKKFQKWFGNPIPADPPIIAEANHTIGDLVSADPLYPSRVDNFQKLLGILILGFRGAIYLGTIARAAAAAPPAPRAGGTRRDRARRRRGGSGRSTAWDRRR